MSTHHNHESTHNHAHHQHHDHDHHDHSGHGGHAGHDHSAMIDDFRKRFWISLTLSLPVVLLSPMLQSLAGLREAMTFQGDSYLQFAFAAVIFVYGGWPFLTGLVSELRKRSPGMMTLIALAITVAFVYSSFVVFGLEGKVFFWELATLIDIMLLGHWIEMRSVQGASRALEELAKLMPSDAHRIDSNGNVEVVPLSELQPGDHVLIKPGEKVPVDGDILKGDSSLNESLLTGESKPVSKGQGDAVVGGSINGEGSLTVAISRTGNDTYLSQVISLVRKAQESRSRTQDFADRAAKWLTYLALSAGAITFVIWKFAVGAAFDVALERTVTVMVITCPHALGLAIPLVVAVSTAMGAKRGLLIRNRGAFERSRNVDAVVFDKTGTLTEGRCGVAGITVFSDVAEKEALALAAAVEAESEHPIAKGIVLEAKNRGINVLAIENFSSITGKGAHAVVSGREVKVVSPGYLREESIEAPNNEERRSMREAGHTVVFVIIDGVLSAAIGLADVVRQSSKAAMQRLKASGVKVMMLTGDAEAVARNVATELDLDEYFAEVLPEQKASKIKELKSRGMKVAMTGDGVNDAPALVEADIGIAIGAGADVAIESADIVLVESDPNGVADVIELSAKTYRKMIQNLWWAAGYNIFSIPLAAGALAPLGIILSPAFGAVLMSLSTVIVAINAQSLKRG